MNLDAAIFMVLAEGASGVIRHTGFPAKTCSMRPDHSTTSEIGTNSAILHILSISIDTIPSGISKQSDSQIVPRTPSFSLHTTYFAYPPKKL
jgi:hypothetical protein